MNLSASMYASKVTAIVLLVCLWSVSSHPTKPLNERSTELAWQAWLLVDENQNKQNDQGIPRRRITPKSVFIAPSFSPLTLPECAEGYSSDSMGRCMKIYKVDQDAQLEFLLKKLNEKFGMASNNEPIEELPTPGPFQVNIPLNIRNDATVVNEEETDVAIVVAPNSDVAKRSDQPAKTVPQNDINMEAIAGILRVNQNEVEATTISETSTFTETAISTSTTTETTTNLDTTLEGNDATTPQQLFFFFGTNTESTPTPTTQTTDASTFKTTFEVMRDLPTTFTTEQTTTKLGGSIRFPEESTARTQFVRFPNYDQFLPYADQSQQQFHQTRDTTKQEGVSFVSDERTHVLTKRPEIDVTSALRKQYQAFHNHRNRDKHNDLFLPARVSESGPRSVVLRFSKKNSFIDNQQLSQPDFVKQIPDDVSYIFSFKNRQRTVS